ncbi:MAG TPA: 2,3,4,5-tetrahydropyridine-2,6-dicarboxylate N-succinyltransferase [Candidatus Acidoferrum sp.]|nr:2,3,4,5-tetrahydropyridine-2,6-dicarboxylate N-succinyltransferase [Candidatus Acidoferrum sp.]
MLQTQIESLFDSPPSTYSAEHHALFAAFKDALNRGTVRAAEPDPVSPTGWRANPWVKKGILLGFRMGTIVDMSVDSSKLPFFDKSTYPLHSFSVADGIRIVPGGSSIRDGAHIARGVICMPPMFVNVGAYVGENTMIDSHALVGSCAQVGRNCHISAASQIGGVLEPVGALPVIIEDEVLVGGNSGIYEGTIVKRRAVLGTGTILNRSIPVYDLVRDTVYSSNADQPLIIPEDAVVIPGSRAVTHPAGKKWGLSLSCAVIVKYRDAQTGSRIQLEDFLR